MLRADYLFGGSSVREWISCMGKTEATDSFAGCSLANVGKNHMSSFVQRSKMGA